MNSLRFTTVAGLTFVAPFPREATTARYAFLSPFRLSSHPPTRPPTRPPAPPLSPHSPCLRHFTAFIHPLAGKKNACCSCCCFCCQSSHRLRLTGSSSRHVRTTHTSSRGAAITSQPVSQSVRLRRKPCSGIISSSYFSHHTPETEVRGETLLGRSQSTTTTTVHVYVYAYLCIRILLSIYLYIPR